jgi:hypothetical protein
VTGVDQTNGVERTVTSLKPNFREGLRSNTFRTTPEPFTGNVDACLAYWAVMEIDCAAVSWPTYGMAQPTLCLTLPTRNVSLDV